LAISFMRTERINSEEKWVAPIWLVIAAHFFLG
jgi:hypothetical protein